MDLQPVETMTNKPIETMTNKTIQNLGPAVVAAAQKGELRQPFRESTSTPSRSARSEDEDHRYESN